MLVHRSRHNLAGTVLLVTALAAAARAEGPATTAVLRVGTSGDYRPFSFHDSSGALTGFDVTVAQRLGRDLGRPLELVVFRWPDLVHQLRTGGFDIAMSGVTVRADRAVDLAFSRPYAVTGAVAVIRTRDRRKFQNVDALDRSDTRIAVNAGGHLEQVARGRFAHARVGPVSNNARLPELLRQGEADAVISEALEARGWPAAEFTVIGPFTRDRKAYAVSRSSAELLGQVNDWLAAREADGWLNQQRRRWFGAAATLTAQQAGIEALVGAIDLRLQLIPSVAAVKRREHVPIADPAQEARVLERARAAATAAGLNADDVAALFRVQMNAAKAVEQHAPDEPARAGAALDDLRAALATVSSQLIAELARCQRWLSDAGFERQLDRAMHAVLTMPGLTSSEVNDLHTALRHVRTAPRP